MSYYYRQVQFGPGKPGLFIKRIIIINAVVFFLALFLGNFIFHDRPFLSWLYQHFGLTPSVFLRHLHLWQPFTYMFLHSNLMHIFFNMLMLWMFGTEIEEKMGTRRFGIFYLFCGASAGLIAYIFSIFCRIIGVADISNIPTIGASGAIYGVMMAFALFFPNRLILLFFVIPVRAFYLMMGLGLMQLYFLTSMSGGGVSYIAHLGGMPIGFLYLKYQWPVAGFIEEFAENRREEKIRSDKKQAEEEQRRTDAILDKINSNGMHTLTREERSFLKERSKRRRR